MRLFSLLSAVLVALAAVSVPCLAGFAHVGKDSEKAGIHHLCDGGKDSCAKTSTKAVLKRVAVLPKQPAGAPLPVFIGPAKPLLRPSYGRLFVRKSVSGAKYCGKSRVDLHQLCRQLN